MQLNSQKSAQDTELYVTFDEKTNSPCVSQRNTQYQWLIHGILFTCRNSVHMDF